METWRGIKLRACPFCGSKEHIHIDKYNNDGYWWTYVECEECQANGPVRKQKRDAVIAWNERFINMDDIEVAES